MKYVIMLAAVFGVWIWIKSLGTKLETTKDALKDSTRVLGDHRLQVRALKESNGKLETEVAKRGEVVEKLKGQKASAESAALLAVSKQRETANRLNATASQLSAIRAKQEADAYVGGIGAVETTALDSVLNRKVAALKSQIRELEQQASDLVRAIDVLKSEKSDLEVTLNNESGKLNELQRQVADVRNLVQAKRAEAKGLFSGKRRRVLGEVDAAIGKVGR